MKNKMMALALIWTGLTPCAFATSTEIKVVLDTFAWFNQIATLEHKSFTQQDVAHYFAKDAKMITNNKVACIGIKGHFDHFVELNEHYKTMQVDVDKIDLRQVGDRIYLDYTINSVNAKQQEAKIHIMGYMVVQNKRIKLFKEVAAFEVGDIKAGVG